MGTTIHKTLLNSQVATVDQIQVVHRGLMEYLAPLVLDHVWWIIIYNSQCTMFGGWTSINPSSLAVHQSTDRMLTDTIRFLCDFGRHGWRSHGTLRAWTRPYSSFVREFLVVSSCSKNMEGTWDYPPSGGKSKMTETTNPIDPHRWLLLGHQFSQRGEKKNAFVQTLTVLYSPVWLAKYICHHQINSGYNVFSAFISPSHWWVNPFQTILWVILIYIYICNYVYIYIHMSNCFILFTVGQKNTILQFLLQGVRLKTLRWYHLAI